MLKIISDNAWAGDLWNEDTPRCALIKRSSRGVVDRGSFVKRAAASSDELLSKIDGMDVKPGEELIHLIALGATEAYGPNRNGDGFSKEASRKYHDTFVKHAHFYRDHKNTDPKKSYGIVKASAFNEAMSRIELIVALNANERAAKANHGLVADREMEKLASGKDIALSMACGVPFDVCSYCGNKAVTQSQYCTGTHEGGMCKAGGLKHNMGRLVSVDGKLVQLYADNTKPDFFDISHVFVPADRIAYASGSLRKAASYNEPVLCGAELARRACLTAPEYLGMSKSASLAAQALLRDAVNAFHSHKLWEKRASFMGVMTSRELKDTQIPRRYKFAELQSALAEQGVCLTPSQFVKLITGNQKEAMALGEIIGPISNDILQNEQLEPVGYVKEGCANSVLRNWVREQQLPSVFPDHFLKQASLAAFEEAPDFTMTKEAVYEMANDPDVRELATQYAMYKLGFVSSLPSSLQQVASELLVGRDYLSF